MLADVCIVIGVVGGVIEMKTLVALGKDGGMMPHVNESIEGLPNGRTEDIKTSTSRLRLEDMAFELRAVRRYCMRHSAGGGKSHLSMVVNTSEMAGRVLARRASRNWQRGW